MSIQDKQHSDIHSYSWVSNKWVIAVTAVTLLFFGAAFLGGGTYSYFTKIGLLFTWSDYTFMGIGVIFLTISSPFIVLFVCKCCSSAKPQSAYVPDNEGIRDNNNIFADYNDMAIENFQNKRKGLNPIEFSVEDQEAIIENGIGCLPSEILLMIFDLIKSRQDLLQNTAVCKRWYIVIKENKNLWKKINFPHWVPLNPYMTPWLYELFPDTASIPTIIELCDDKIFIKNRFTFQYTFENLISTLFLFQKMKSAVLKGQSSEGNWFFLIRFNRWENGEKFNGVLAIYNLERSVNRDWMFQVEYERDNLQEPKQIKWRVDKLLMDDDKGTHKKNILGLKDLLSSKSISDNLENLIDFCEKKRAWNDSRNISWSLWRPNKNIKIY